MRLMEGSSELLFVDILRAIMENRITPEIQAFLDKHNVTFKEGSSDEKVHQPR